MKKKLFTTVIFSILLTLCFGQDTSANKNKRSFKILHIIRIQNQPTLITTNELINPALVVSRTFTKNSSIQKNRELFDVDFIWFEVLKPEAKLSTLNDVFEKYKIPSNLRKSPVKIDDEFIDYPETLVISLDGIDKVRIIKSNRGRYIQIISNGYYENKDREKEGGLLYD